MRKKIQGWYAGEVGKKINAGQNTSDTAIEMGIPVVALTCGTADRGTAEPAEPREITSFFSFATYIPGIRLQLISLLCINPDFIYFLT